MKKPVDILINDQWVRSQRGDKNLVSAEKPYAFQVESERNQYGDIEEIATLFLTNKECPFQCLMCDLWKNTTNTPVKPGDIPRQIEWALNKLPPATSIKLYNSGNFFDSKAIPVSDYNAIADLLQGFTRVIIENHPRLLNKHTFEFQETLKPELEIAMGLETVHPEVLKLLNKKMSLDDYSKAVELLGNHSINVRAFILLRPPFLSESEGIEWAKRSIDYAFEIGVQSAVVIPTRHGNGALDQLGTTGHFTPPNLESLEEVLAYGIQLSGGNVFADLWDLGLFSSCTRCLSQRKERLRLMNLHQQVYPEIECGCQSPNLPSSKGL